MIQDLIIEKIKKLLRMKRGGTAGEIENALALAAELARKHGIDLASVNEDETTQSIRHVEEALTSRLPLEAKNAAAILVIFFNVNVVVKQQRHPRRVWHRQYVAVFVGTDWDREVARYVFIFLQKHFRNAWSQRDNGRLKNRAAFLDGMFIGLAAKLETERNANRPNETGLMLIGRGLKLRADYVQAHWPNSVKSDIESDKSGAAAAKWAGVQAGQKTNIRKAVDSGSAAAQAPRALPAPKRQLDLF
jgi:hypothetical protein